MPIGLPHSILLGLSLVAGACDPTSAAAPGDPPARDDEPTSAGADPTDVGAVEWGDPLPLIDGEAWVTASAQEDPLADERPAEVLCPGAAWGPELGGLEIQTGSCNYFFATQPSLAAIEAGDAIEVLVFHDRLDAAEPAAGHVALLLDDEVVWEQWVEIPAEADVLEAQVKSDRAWPAGTRVGLHLHNHGYNAWTLLDVSTASAAQ